VRGYPAAEARAAVAVDGIPVRHMLVWVFDRLEELCCV
jgi:hypothetical protein